TTFFGKVCFFLKKRHLFNVSFFRTKCSSGLASALGVNNEVYLKVDSEVDSEVEERADFKACIFGKTRSTCHMFNVPFSEQNVVPGWRQHLVSVTKSNSRLTRRLREGRYFKA
ncbi:unnamed protein product, partial [Sphacelaria rigidula]